MDGPCIIFLSCLLGILTLQLQVAALKLKHESDIGYKELQSLRNISGVQWELQRTTTKDTPAVEIPKLENCNYKSYEIMTDVPNNYVYQVCYDDTKYSSKWSRAKIKLKPECVTRENYFAKETWMKEITIDQWNKIYSLDGQKKSFVDRFPNLLVTGKTCWFSSHCASLVKGHLTPFADMFDEKKAKATNRIINVAPQWGQFNSGNWLDIENAIRSWLKKNPTVSITVTTGTSGQIEFKGFSKKQFYLGKSKDLKDIIEVPLFFWKLICSIDQKETFIFGINFVFDPSTLTLKKPTKTPKRKRDPQRPFDVVRNVICRDPIGFEDNTHPFNVLLPETADDSDRGVVFGCRREDILDTEINQHKCK